jgi:hypothetical protein
MGCVLPVVVHLRDTLLFVYYIVCAMGDVPFGFFEATKVHRAIHNATHNKVGYCLTLNSIFRVTPERGHRSILSASHRCHERCRGKRHTHSITSSAGHQCGGIRPFLFLFVGSEGWLPRCGFSAWRRGNCLYLLFLWFLCFSIASLLAFCHVDLLGFANDANWIQSWLTL